jgi:hypothetical protein
VIACMFRCGGVASSARIPGGPDAVTGWPGHRLVFVPTSADGRRPSGLEGYASPSVSPAEAEAIQEITAALGTTSS